MSGPTPGCTCDFCTTERRVLASIHEQSPPPAATPPPEPARQVGICGTSMTGLATGARGFLVCELPAGHEGWHRDGVTSWGYVSEETREALLSIIRTHRPGLTLTHLCGQCGTTWDTHLADLILAALAPGPDTEAQNEAAAGASARAELAALRDALERLSRHVEQGQYTHRGLVERLKEMSSDE